jgi:glycosyltransferase involved in cell wall biosynthesis
VKKTAYSAYSRADKLLTVSSSFREKIKKHFQIESDVIFNIADTTTFKYTDRKDQNRFIFISVGRLDYNKGTDVLIEAFKNADFNETVTLLIAGSGPFRSRFQKIIDSCQLSDQIKLLGFLERKRIAALMDEAHAFVLASRKETFGVAYIEAMVAGLPVIATRCGGPEDYIHDGNGILVPVGNSGELTRALMQMYTTWNQFDRREISEQCKKRFSPQAVAKQLERVYLEVLNK